ncbi:protein kinase [Cryobacterium sp. SO2]|nr:serine/threonine-protein kinase [Cryobacterium sp. SO2]WEO79282.1 protein kinase [Cryobacterium sp. SO2]
MREPTRTDPALGLTLANRYRLDRLIGSGGMAAVYQAADLALGRTVAVKLLGIDPVGGAGAARHSDEVAVLAHLNHFALVTLYDAGNAVIGNSSRPFIVTEYVAGTDLRSRLLDGALSPGEVARLGADLCEALHYMASLGIIHRDIKPANVLLAPADFPGRIARAKLADFGIARLFDAAHRTEAGTVIGTAGYLSPEQAGGLPVGPATDVYSLGLVLLECLTGEHCYPGTAVESALARLQRQPEIPDRLGRQWHELLTGMTARAAEDRLRPADAAVRLLALVPPVEVSPVDAPPVDAPQVAAPPADVPTLVLALPAPPSPTSQRMPDPAKPIRAEATTPTRATAPPRRWPVVIGGILVALLTVIAVLFVVPGAAPAPDPPAYPAVDGQLGEHLQELQESVDP